MVLLLLALSPADAQEAVLHGTVERVYHCAEVDDSAAWTYVTLTVYDVLSGAVQLDDQTFVVRQKVGYYADGSVGGLVGTPQFAVDDEVIVPVRFDRDGEQFAASIQPDLVDGYRVIPGLERSDDDVLVDFAGHPVAVAPGGQLAALPVAVRELNRQFPADMPHGGSAAADSRVLQVWTSERQVAGPQGAGSRLLADVRLTSDSGDQCEGRVPVFANGSQGSFEFTCNLSPIGSVTYRANATIPADGHARAVDARLANSPVEGGLFLAPAAVRTSLDDRGAGRSKLQTARQQGVTVDLVLHERATARFATRNDAIDALMMWEPTDTWMLPVPGQSANAAIDGCIVPTGPQR